MLAGLFVPGHNLERYFNRERSDWLGARKIVNDSDKASTIKTFALNMLAFLELDGAHGGVNPSSVDQVLELSRALQAANASTTPAAAAATAPAPGAGDPIYLPEDMPVPARNADHAKDVLAAAEAGALPALGDEPTIPDLDFDEERQGCCCCGHRSD